MSHATPDPPGPQSSDGDDRVPATAPRERRRRINTKGRTLREFTARGVIVNTSFDLGISALNLVRGFVLAVILSRSDYGVWGILVVSLGVLARLKLVGISDKYIQQDEPDQELAFQRAFTLEVLITCAAMIPIAAALPVIALVYGHWSLIPPGLVLITTLMADALQSPLWVYYRTMDFFRQRLLSTFEPVVGLIVAVGLALAGAGYWALAIGVVAGAWAGAIVALKMSPYRLRWRYDRRALKVYASFSGPIFVATACSVLLANGTAIAANAHLGLVAVGALALAGNITAFTNRVDDLVASTLYPAICAIQDRVDLLYESFVKSNRLALMWAMPFGAGLGLFAGELVHFVLGDKWRPAIGLLQATGVVAAISHIGFNWDDYFRARADTRPIAVVSVVTTICLLGAAIPLLFAYGLPGLAAGIAIGGTVSMVLRAYYLRRLFDGFSFLRHAGRAVLPTAPAVAAVLAIRALHDGRETSAATIVQLVVYVVVTGIFTWAAERALLREALGYVFHGRPDGT